MPTWIRVRDISTRHEFDVEASAMRHGLEPLHDPGWPDLDGPGAVPRPAKPFVDKDGQPAAAVDSAEPKTPKKSAPGAAGMSEGVEQ